MIAPVKTPPRSLEVSIKFVTPHPANPRRDFDETELRQLANSLAEHGLIEPIVVRKSTGRTFQLVAGERRLRAAALAGWEKIPAIVRELTDADALVLQLVENLQRRDLNAIEKAQGIKQLCEPTENGGAGKTHAEAGEMFGRERAWATNLIRLLTLPEVWQQRIVTGELSESQARALLPYARKPAILARIEADMVKNPWAWRTREDFERNAAQLASDSESPAVAELKPARVVRGAAAARNGQPLDTIPIRPRLVSDAAGDVATQWTAADIASAVAALETIEELQLVTQAVAARQRELEGAA